MSDDRVLSEVHVGRSSKSQIEEPTSSTFYFIVGSGEDDQIREDEDGDLMVPRAKIKPVKISHLLATSLEDVGLQVWNGALLLCDFILSHSDIFSGAYVCEFGSGVGLVCEQQSVGEEDCGGDAIGVVYTFAPADIGQRLLTNCRANLAENEEEGDGEVRVRHLDWCASDSFAVPSSSGFAWSEDDVAILRDQVKTFVAADVVYDETLTDGLLRCVSELLPADGVVYIALERRIVFTVQDLEAMSPSFDYFVQRIGHYGLQGQSIVIDFEQHVKYDRSPYLVLWELRRKPR